MEIDSLCGTAKLIGSGLCRIQRFQRVFVGCASQKSYMELCPDAESAIHKLTRRRFEAVIVDCADPRTASRVLRSARSAPCNKRAVAVAIVGAQTNLGSERDLGAHFVLHQPLSPERAKTSFRAVRALMKRERRRNARITVETPVTIQVNDGAGQLRAVSSDIGEGGIAVQLAHRPKNLGPVSLQFSLPGTQHKIECTGEVAWENPGRQVGLRFLNLTPAMELVNELYALETRVENVPAGDSPANAVPVSLLADIQRTLALLLAPFAPYLAHELWEILGEKGSLLRAPWPEYDPALAKEEEIELPVQVNGKLRSRIVVPADAADDLVRERALADEKIVTLIAGKQIVKVIVVTGKLVNIVVR